VHGTAANGKTSAFRVAIKRGTLRRKRLNTESYETQYPRVHRARLSGDRDSTRLTRGPDKRNRRLSGISGRAALKIRELSALIGYTGTRGGARVKVSNLARMIHVIHAKKRSRARSRDASRRAVVQQSRGSTRSRDNAFEQVERHNVPRAFADGDPHANSRLADIRDEIIKSRDDATRTCARVCAGARTALRSQSALVYVTAHLHAASTNTRASCA